MNTYKIHPLMKDCFFKLQRIENIPTFVRLERAKQVKIEENTHMYSRHKETHPSGDPNPRGSWIITNCITGLCVGEGKTIVDAIENANKKIKRHIEEYPAAIETAIKKWGLSPQFEYPTDTEEENQPNQNHN